MTSTTPSAKPPTLTVGALRETADRERRVALDPEAAAAFIAKGFAVSVEKGAGSEARFPDAAYLKVGVTMSTREDVIAKSDILAVVRPPDAALAAALRSGQMLVGLVEPLANTDLTADLATRGVTVVAFELLPRTISRAQAMDAVSSQASTAGYRAGILAAASFDRYFPMMITASGTARPAKLIVIGAGVAGLQAIGTAKRLGAVVTGYDVRAASQGEVESLGAEFLTSSIAAGAAAGGYARAMTADEAVQQQDELSTHLESFDVIITTAKVPGRTPPLLVTAATLTALAPGSVCIDLAATDQRGNVAGSIDGKRLVTDGGVIVVGAGNLASDLATSSSHMYARNVLAMVTSLTKDGVVTIDPTDEVHAAVVVSHDGHLTTAPSAAPTKAPVS
ncbi:NAD(P) transhydrogenase subunit alpha (plasmid) [Frondihabitans sp. PAMC 28766]|uniref:NAD(P) transhydrogenase subunit alpha n=1 Tax=Frondihabitans sp. PAMC 28766 TaxID=1795630 RepID=UPI00078BCA7E|nr:NAD(P) transhydrogenase subunit alpha [Frondihabitans sp. PAMC 28766]AMM22690.1 NAD(P) transhydrogenase subunit alpha [Frondihabitans sp. PAMC 28766]